MSVHPTFRYHPDPVATGSAIRSDEPCSVCDRPSEFRYVGAIFGRQADVLCLRCIANGMAASALASPDDPAEFTDVGWGVPHDVPPSVITEVAQRTPGFVGWQQEHWMYHCSDAAAYLGRVGWSDVEAMPDAVKSLQDELAQLGVDLVEADRQIRMLHRDGDLTGYLFRCLHCGVHLAYSDAS